MVKTFFENLRATQPDPIYPYAGGPLMQAINQADAGHAGAKGDNIVRLGNGIIRNIHLPASGYGGDTANSAAYKERIALPFSVSKKGKTRRGIIYLPAYEAEKIDSRGNLKDGVTNLDAYGAEMGEGDYDTDSLNKLLEGSDQITFDMDNVSLGGGYYSPGAKSTYELVTGKKYTAPTALQMKASLPNFIKQLRSDLWGA